MANEKKELLMVSPTMFVDRQGNIWDWRDGPPILGNIKCVVCDKPVASTRYSYTEVGDNVCRDCARIVVLSEMWNHYDKYHNVARLYNSFPDVLRQGVTEFEMHMPKKHHSWKDVHPGNLRKTLERCFYKFELADDEEVELEELIDLMLMCMMLGQRLLWSAKNPTIPM